jgi:NAD(P)-dependent dehydrogenase (short-subunit alcohol dehydrogenase family)
MKVLVVGGSGLLGRALVKAFSNAGHEVSVCVRGWEFVFFVCESLSHCLSRTRSPPHRCKEVD